jgi:predicted MPP superfamily phosphohydrolase
VLDPILNAMLLAGAFVGHFALLIASHNWWYGRPLPKHSGKLIHGVHALLILVGPPALWYAGGWDVSVWFVGPGQPWWSWLVAGYLVLCWVIGFVFVPLNILGRLRRRDPAALVGTRSHVLDVTKELGYPPHSRAKRSLLAHFPGNEIFDVEFVERVLRLPRWPAALDGLTLLHLSDLHFHGTPDREFYRVVMQRCAELEPDIVVLTGDIVDSVFHHGWILPALGWLRWRCAGLAILGNHDIWYEPDGVRAKLKELGFDVIGNSWRKLEVRGQPLVVIGNEGPWFEPEPDLSSCPEGLFRLCLSHTPDNIAWAKRHVIDLMLAGHVHGGQVRFPVIGSLLVPSCYGRYYDCGLFDEPPTLLCVSRGLGGEHPLRLNCRPEVTLYTLKSTEAGS